MRTKKPSSFAALYDLEKSARQSKEIEPPSGSQSGSQNQQLAPTSGSQNQQLAPTSGSHFVAKSDTDQPIDTSSKTNLSVKAKYNPDRHAPGKVRISIRYSISIHQQMKDFCDAHGLQIQDLHELAITHYIQTFGSHTVGAEAPTGVGAEEPHDDLMIFKTHDDIIMLFKRMTGRKWTASDDRAAVKFNNIDRRLIEIGMIHTALQARGRRINSFAYFIPEIQTMIDANFDRSNLDVYLKARRKMLDDWLKKQGREPLNLGKFNND